MHREKSLDWSVYKLAAKLPSAFGFQAAGKVQEKPAAARVEVEDPDCQRVSED